MHNTDRFIYERVVILGVDGAGRFFADAVTPNCDRIFKDGAVNYGVLTSFPTASAECWGSMLIGVVPEIHGLTNSIVAAMPYGTDSMFPTVFRCVREAYPEAAIGAFGEWDGINNGIIEHNLGVHFGFGGSYEVVDQICEYVRESKPKLLFVQFDETDGVGHRNGYGSAAHLENINRVDGYIGTVYDTYRSEGLLDSTLFIVTSDHGGTPEGGHGGWSDGEKYVFWGARGKSVKQGSIGEMEIRDNAAVVLYALGIEPPAKWTARVPDSLFYEVGYSSRPTPEFDFAYPHRTHENAPTPDHAEISDILGGENIIAYLPFDGSAEPAIAADGISTSVHGKLYITEGYFGDGAKLDDSYITIHGMKLTGGDFTVSTWVKTGGIGPDALIFSNKDYSTNRNDGMALLITRCRTVFNIAGNGERIRFDNPLPVDFKNGWVHLILTYDSTTRTATFYNDFKKYRSELIGEEIPNECFDVGLEYNIGNDGLGKYRHGLSAVLDDFIVTSSAITDGQVEALRKHYCAL